MPAEIQKAIDFAKIDTDKFGEAVAHIANRNVKTAIKVSAESADNPHLYRKPKAVKEVAKAIF